MRLFKPVMLLFTAAMVSMLSARAETRWIVIADRAREVAMALSAAPADLRSGAGLYVFDRRRFVQVRASANGYNCLVERDERALAPVCYDAEGSRTLLRGTLELARLVASGMSDAGAQQRVEAEYRSGRLHAPRRAGLAYMLSTSFVMKNPKTGMWRQVFPPHVMIYAPYLRNADIGVLRKDVRSTSHIWIESEGTAEAMIIVVPKP